MGTNKLKAVLFLMCCSQSLLSQHPYIKVDANGYHRLNTIIEATLNNALSPAYSYQVRNTITGKKALAQLTGKKNILFILPDTLQPGQQAVYKIERTAVAATSPVDVRQTDKGLLVSVNGKNLLFYHTAVAKPPADSPAYYARSGFIHPLYSPSGAVLTDDFPAGHAHQHGLMMAWVNTRFKNIRPDFWNQQQQKGNVRHMKLLSVQRGPVVTFIKIALQHYTSETTVLNEIWTITVYSFSKYFLYDIRSDQLNPTADTLTINQYHYGGMALRGSRQWNPDDKEAFSQAWKVQTDSGFSVANGNGKHAAYVAASGPVNGRNSGVAVYGFPDNFRYPQAIRIHPTMPYWCYAPSVDGMFTINPQQTFTSRFRYFVCDGLLDTLFARQLLDDIQHPPMVTCMILNKQD